MNANGRVIGMNTLITVTFPLSPLMPMCAIVHKETTDGHVWGIGCWVKVERDLDPDIAQTGNFWVWRLRGVKFEPSEFELFGILGRGPGTVRTSFGE
jgi:hypothetical protein